MNINDSKTASVKVTENNCAAAMGSGSLEVFATPAMVALMEKAACAVVGDALNEGESTVGTKMDVAHLKATPLGDTVTAEAVLTAQEGRKLTFRVSARDSRGTIGEGTHERFIINIEKFLSKLK